MPGRGRPRKYVYPEVPEEPGYYVYEFWSEAGCLYVGRVGNSGPGSMYNRLAGHRTKPWWLHVAHIVVSAYASHEEIVDEEARRIFELEPLHNQVYAARCRKGHARRPHAERESAARDRRGNLGCAECQREWHRSPEFRAWQNEYRQRPEVKFRISEHWRSPEYKAWREEYRARPGVKEREDAYQAAYRQRPERIAQEQQRTRERDWQEDHQKRRWYKQQWAARTVRRPSSGQAALFLWRIASRRAL